MFVIYFLPRKKSYSFGKGLGVNTMKTIKQIADDLKVPKDKVKYQVRKLPVNYLVKKGNVTYIKNEGIKRIQENIGKSYPGNTQEKSGENKEGYPPIINLLQATIETLQKQLEVKDSQISELLKLNDQQQQLFLKEQAKTLPAPAKIWPFKRKKKD